MRFVWVMELSMANRKAITRARALRYRTTTKVARSAGLDSVSEVTGYNRTARGGRCVGR